MSEELLNELYIEQQNNKQLKKELADKNINYSFEIRQALIMRDILAAELAKMTPKTFEYWKNFAEEKQRAGMKCDNEKKATSR